MQHSVLTVVHSGGERNRASEEFSTSESFPTESFTLGIHSLVYNRFEGLGLNNLKGPLNTQCGILNTFHFTIMAHSNFGLSLSCIQNVARFICMYMSLAIYFCINAPLRACVERQFQYTVYLVYCCTAKS